MRAAGLIGFGLLIVHATLGQAEATTPYEVLVGESGLDVRSGPGQPFYVTDHVAAGTKLEVYRREEGGWLGIRPPEGSYSWVRKDQLRSTNTDGVAKVTEQGALCRIGSRVVPTPEHVCQVSLRQGELVEVLEEQTATDAATEAEEIWCRIAPPAGEFRWVLASDLAPRQVPAQAATPVRELPTMPTAPPSASPAQETQVQAETWTPRRGPGRELAADTAPGHPPALTIAAEGPRETVKIVEPAAAPVAPSSPPASGPKPSGVDVPAVAKLSEPAVRLPPESELPRVPPKPTQTAETVAPAQPPAAIVELPTPPPSAPVEPAWIARDKSPRENLDQLDLELSLQVSQEMRAWRLEPLRKRVEALLGKLDTASDKQAAAELLRRIRQFEDLEDRIVQAGSNLPGGVAAIAQGSPGGTPAVANTGPRFDGSGWLVSVHSTTRTAPPYALLSADGDVLQYVYPSPGLNLHRYERKQVGIYGQRGLNTALNKPALTAERIVDIDRHFR